MEAVGRRTPVGASVKATVGDSVGRKLGLSVGNRVLGISVGVAVLFMIERYMRVRYFLSKLSTCNQ